MSSPAAALDQPAATEQPSMARNRLVLVVYADGATKGPVELQQMQRLAAAVTAAVERCILQKKAKAQ